MKKNLTIIFFIISLITVTYYLHSLPKENLIEISHAVIFQPHQVKMATASQMNIINNSDSPLIITGLKSASFKRAIIHHTEFKKGEQVMSSASSLTIEAHKTMIISANGTHFMLFEPQQQLNIGDLITMTLKTNQGEIPFVAKVIKIKLR